MTNKELVLKFIDEVFNAHDLTRVDDYVREDYIQHSPEVENGREGFKRFAAGFFTQDPFMDVFMTVAEDDKVVVFFKCKMKGGVAHKVVDIYRVQDGKLAEHWDCIMPNVKDEDCASGEGHFAKNF